MLDNRIENYHRLTYQEREDIVFEKQKERRDLKEKIHRGWLSESERIKAYQRVRQLNRDLYFIFKLNEALDNTTLGKVQEFGRAVQNLKDAIKEAFKDDPIVNFIKRLLRF